MKCPCCGKDISIPCDKAEKTNNGECLGFSHFDDDEPIEECKRCLKYESYEED